MTIYVRVSDGSKNPLDSGQLGELKADLGVEVQSGPLVSDPNKAPNAAAVADAISAVTTGSVEPIATTFATAIPFDKVQGRLMPAYAQTADMVLTVAAGAVEQGSCNFCIDGDGSHNLDVTAFKVVNSYVFNKAKRNIYSAVYAYGNALLAGQVAEIPAPPDTVKPTLSKAEVTGEDLKRITLTWSEELNSDISAASAFRVVDPNGNGGLGVEKTVTSHVYVDPTHSYLTTAEDFAAGETFSIMYTAPSGSKMRDLAGNLLDNIAGKVITNSIVATTPANLRFGTLGLGVVESGDAGAGYTYEDASGAGSWWAGNSGRLTTPDKSLPGDGSISTTIRAGGPNVGHGIGLCTVSTNEAGVNGWEYVLLGYSLYGDPWVATHTTRSLGADIQGSSIATDPDDILRLTRSGGTITAAIAKAATPTTFTDIRTWTGVPAGTLYPQSGFNVGANSGQKAGPYIIVGGV